MNRSASVLHARGSVRPRVHSLAHAHRDLGHLDQARDHWQRALDILTDLDLTDAEELPTEQIRTHLRTIPDG